MYQKHNTFQAPPDPQERIWRYMDFAKFMHMIDTSCLHFSTPDTLRKTDPFEGIFPKAVDKKVRREDAQREEQARNEGRRTVQFPTVPQSLSQWASINCWHVNKHESEAMWKLYRKSNEGIAIQSTYQRMIDSFHNSEPIVHVGLVSYIDYETEAYDCKNAFQTLLHKRKSYEHERELRAVAYDEDPDTVFKHVDEEGIDVKVDLTRLIEAVYLDPLAPNWLEHLVGSLISRLGYNFALRSSKLLEAPCW